MTATFPDVVPYLYYPDASGALRFLADAFGFEEHSVTRGPDGAVWTAQLSTGAGLVMIGPGMDEFGTRYVADADWATCRVHVLVDDVDAHYERAVAAGAVIRAHPMEFGGTRLYIASDIGGQQWIFAQR